MEKLTLDSLVLLKDGYRDSRIVRVGDILRIEVAGNDMIVKVNGEAGSITVRGSLKRCLEKLPERQFFRVSRGCLVNLSQVGKVSTVGRNFLLFMKDGTEITMSRVQSRLLRKELAI